MGRVTVRAKLWLSALALGCGVQDRAAPITRDVPFACETDRDCSLGDCLTDLGICMRRTGQLMTLLFEVTPQASDPVYGGARFLKILDIGDSADPEELLALNVRPRVPVSGRVIPAPEQAACLRPGLSTLQAALTFTPQERLLGLSLPSYELSTRLGEENGVFAYTFAGSLPPGHYDVYMQPTIASTGEDCRAIPQIFRDQIIEETSGSDLRLQQPTPASLRLTIIWQDNLEGWLLDMIHPVTGEVISNRVRLRADALDATGTNFETTLNYSRAGNEFMGQTADDPDSMGQTADEVVRLTPPDGLFAGTVLLYRSGLELLTPGEGVIGDVSTFGTPVEFQAWVWKKDAPDTPVPGNVSFSALDLGEGPEGVLTSFESSAEVNAQGQVKLPLLPGRYRIRVTPPGIEMANLGLMAGFQSNITVWPPMSNVTALQGGQVIEVPPAVSIEGSVVAAGSNMPIRGVEVRASASNPDRDACLDVPGNANLPGCERELPPVLRKVLAQDPFVPRTRNAISQGDGRFEIGGLDCGECEEGAGARFDLTVRPQLDTGLPWLVRTSIDLYANRVMEPLEMPMPVARRVLVTYGDPVTVPRGDPLDSTDDERITPGLEGALIRVFALIDDQSQLVSDPEELLPCVVLPTANSPRCVQSLVQVAEGRSGTDGELLLLLPPRLE